MTRIRWPHGVQAASFFEKNAPGRHAVVGADRHGADHRLPGRSSKNGDTLVFPIVDDLATLTWLVNLAALELHVHQWTVGRNGRPRNADRLVIDLDPGEPAGLHECCGVALLVRERLAERGLTARPVTSGSKGLHLYADLPGRMPSERVHRAGQGGRRGAPARAPEAGDRHDDQGEAWRQGLPRLVAERRLQDHHLAVLPARTRATPGRHAGDLGRGGGGRRRPAGPGAVRLRAGAPAGRRVRRPVRARLRPGARLLLIRGFRVAGCGRRPLNVLGKPVALGGSTSTARSARSSLGGAGGRSTKKSEPNASGGRRSARFSDFLPSTDPGMGVAWRSPSLRTTRRLAPRPGPRWCSRSRRDPYARPHGTACARGRGRG